MNKIFKKKYVAELVGTFSLTLMVLLTLMSGVPEAVPFLAAITLTIFVYTIGSISGCHINPAITIGQWSVQKIHKLDVIGYLVAQIVGALLAMQVASLLVGDLPILAGTDTPAVGIAEALGAAFLSFGVSAVAFGKTGQGSSGITIGGSLLLGILIASSTSNGILNPAVAIGTGAISFTYLLAPIVGAVLSAQLYRWLAK